MKIQCKLLMMGSVNLTQYVIVTNSVKALKAERASGLQKTDWWVLAWLSVWGEVQICI